MDVEPLREFALRKTEGNAKRYERPPEPVKVLELGDVATLQTLVALDLLDELEMKRPKRIERALEFVALEPRVAQPELTLSLSQPLLKGVGKRVTERGITTADDAMELSLAGWNQGLPRAL